jgi:hypothetical protein
VSLPASRRVTLSAKDANQLVDALRTSCEGAWDAYTRWLELVADAYNGRAWEPLNLRDWAAFVAHTFDTSRLRIPPAERADICRRLAAAGMPRRAIALATGASVGSVQNAISPPAERSKVNGASLPPVPDIPFPVHEFLAKIPEFHENNPGQFWCFVDDIRDHGLLQPIVQNEDGVILDGRARLRACLLTGTAPRFRVFKGDFKAEVNFIYNINCLRSHFSLDQLAIVAAEALDSDDPMIQDFGADMNAYLIQIEHYEEMQR